jgi:large subunit ribosomal protein L6
VIVLPGVDLQKVGMAAAEIRALRKPNPFTGKGIRYTDEVVVLKQGKKKWG